MSVINPEQTCHFLVHAHVEHITDAIRSNYLVIMCLFIETDELPTIDSESEHEDISMSNEQISLVSSKVSFYTFLSLVNVFTKKKTLFIY